MPSITENTILAKVHSLGISGIEVAPDISPNGLLGCKQYIAPLADPRTILFVTNAGALGRGVPKTGVALNGEYLFYRNLKQEPVAIRLKEITAVEYHPCKQHKDGTYHNGDLIILHCGSKADRHMEDCLIGCDCVGMSMLLQGIVSQADQMSVQIQNRSLLEMPEELRVNYLKILCNYCYQIQNEITPDALSSVHIVANRLNLSSDSKMCVTEYTTDMEHRETTGNLISAAAQGVSAGDLNTLRITLLFDTLYFCTILHGNIDAWKADGFILGLAKVLRVSHEQLVWLNQLWQYAINTICLDANKNQKQKRQLDKLADLYHIPTHALELSFYQAQSVVLGCQRYLKQHKYWRYFNLLKENTKLLPDSQCKILQDRCLDAIQADLQRFKTDLVEDIDSSILSECAALCEQTQNNEHYHLLAYLYAQAGDRVRMEATIDHLKSEFVTEFDIKQEIDTLYKIACCQMNRKMYQLYQLFLTNPKKAIKEENGIKDSMGLDLLDYWLLMQEQGDGWELIKSGKFIRDQATCIDMPPRYGCFAVIHRDDELGMKLFLYTTNKGYALLKTVKNQRRKEAVVEIVKYIIDSLVENSKSSAKVRKDEAMVQRFEMVTQVTQDMGNRFLPDDSIQKIEDEIQHEYHSYLDRCTEELQKLQSGEDEYSAFLWRIYDKRQNISELAQLNTSNCILKKCNEHTFVEP